MSYTFLLDAGEESSAESFSDIPVSVLLRLSLTVEKSCFNGNAMESCHDSQSGMTCEHLTENPGRAKPMSCAAVSLAKTLAAPVSVGELKASKVDCGTKCGESFAKLDRASRLWKTHQRLLVGDWELFCEIWPKWGWMQDGACWEPTMSAQNTIERESGFWPTPSGTSNHGRNRVVGRLDEWGGSGNPFRGTNLLGLRCPDFEDWMIGLPVSWTELTPYAMPKFQQWLNSHGKH